MRIRITCWDIFYPQGKYLRIDETDFCMLWVLFLVSNQQSYNDASDDGDEDDEAGDYNDETDNLIATPDTFIRRLMPWLHVK